MILSSFIRKYQFLLFNCSHSFLCPARTFFTILFQCSFLNWLKLPLEQILSWIHELQIFHDFQWKPPRIVCDSVVEFSRDHSASFEVQKKGEKLPNWWGEGTTFFFFFYKNIDSHFLPISNVKLIRSDCCVLEEAVLIVLNKILK